MVKFHMVLLVTLIELPARRVGIREPCRKLCLRSQLDKASGTMWYDKMEGSKANCLFTKSMSSSVGKKRVNEVGRTVLLG